MSEHFPEQGWRRAGEAVQLRRGECHWTQAELSRRSGVNVTTIQVFEAGRPPKRGHHLSTLAAMSSALGWAPDQLQRIAAGEVPPWHIQDDVLKTIRETHAALEAQVTSAAEQMAALSERVTALELATLSESADGPATRGDAPGPVG